VEFPYCACKVSGRWVSWFWSYGGETLTFVIVDACIKRIGLWFILLAPTVSSGGSEYNLLKVEIGRGLALLEFPASLRIWFLGQR